MPADRVRPSHTYIRIHVLILFLLLSLPPLSLVLCFLSLDLCSLYSALSPSFFLPPPLASLQVSKPQKPKTVISGGEDGGGGGKEAPPPPPPPAPPSGGGGDCSFPKPKHLKYYYELDRCKHLQVRCLYTIFSVAGNELFEPIQYLVL